jgi:ribosomal protein S28E/S33
MDIDIKVRQGQISAEKTSKNNPTFSLRLSFPSGFIEKPVKDEIMSVSALVMNPGDKSKEEIQEYKETKAPKVLFVRLKDTELIITAVIPNTENPEKVAKQLLKEMTRQFGGESPLFNIKGGIEEKKEDTEEAEGLNELEEEKEQKLKLFISKFVKDVGDLLSGIKGDMTEVKGRIVEQIDKGYAQIEKSADKLKGPQKEGALLILNNVQILMGRVKDVLNDQLGGSIKTIQMIMESNDEKEAEVKKLLGEN